MLTTNPSQTKELGKRLARRILRKPPAQKAVVLALVGDLGGGKTTFLQGFGKEVGIQSNISSPTFVIMKKYKIFNLQSSIFKYLYHIDCYRIQKPKEILGLGFKEIIADPKNIIAIEWADKIKEILPKETIWIKFEFVSPVRELKKNGKSRELGFSKTTKGMSKNTRKVIIEGHKTKGWNGNKM